MSEMRKTVHAKIMLCCGGDFGGEMGTYTIDGYDMYRPPAGWEKFVSTYVGLYQRAQHL